MKVTENQDFNNEACYNTVKRIAVMITGADEVVDKIVIIILNNDKEILVEKDTCLDEIFQHRPNALTVFTSPVKEEKNLKSVTLKMLGEMISEAAKKAKSFPADLATVAGI
jgi:sugar-specific transcriptional regulator TrmB